MHDALPSFDTTVVIDDPDGKPFVRAVAEDLTMQVHLGSTWHRRTPDLSSTACGVPIHSGFAATRREVLTGADGGLCADCFTQFEHRRAAELDTEREQHEARADEERGRKWREQRIKRNTQGDR